MGLRSTHGSLILERWPLLENSLLQYFWHVGQAIELGELCKCTRQEEEEEEEEKTTATSPSRKQSVSI
jgi:hypothetical protein